MDRAMNLTERSELERLGCAYRVIFPEMKDVPAQPDWSSERTEIVLREDDGTAAKLIEEAYQLAVANAAQRRSSGMST